MNAPLLHTVNNKSYGGRGRPSAALVTITTLLVACAVLIVMLLVGPESPEQMDNIWIPALTYPVENPTPQFQLVESVPCDLSVSPIPASVPTSTALIALLQSATKTLDVTVMYWELTAKSDPFCNQVSLLNARRCRGRGCTLANTSVVRLTHVFVYRTRPC